MVYWCLSSELPSELPLLLEVSWLCRNSVNFLDSVVWWCSEYSQDDKNGSKMNFLG